MKNARKFIANVVMGIIVLFFLTLFWGIPYGFDAMDKGGSFLGGVLAALLLNIVLFVVGFFLYYSFTNTK